MLPAPRKTLQDPRGRVTLKLPFPARIRLEPSRNRRNSAKTAGKSVIFGRREPQSRDIP